MPPSRKKTPEPPKLSLRQAITLPQITTPLSAWFTVHHRPLPWRTNLPSAPGFASLSQGLKTPRDAYATLVAETMLQQTQVSRVLEYLPRFLHKFPTIAALANAEESAVLASWAGLGYYRRAKLLHQAARKVMQEFAGAIPQSIEDLRSLPGVGRYTAGAVASIALHQPAPILDGNITRVLMRLTACDQSPTDRPVQNALWQLAEDIAQHASITQGTPAIVNEALMELGAMICTPVSPKCQACPVSHACNARKLGLESSIPRPKPAAKTSTLHLAALIITDAASRVMLQQRPGTGLFASMLTPVTFEQPSPISLTALSKLTATLEIPIPAALKPLTTYTHQLTHRTLKITVYHLHWPRDSKLPPGCTWHPIASLSSLPIATAHRKALTAALAI